MASAAGRSSTASPSADVSATGAFRPSSLSGSGPAAPAAAPVPLGFALNTLDTADARNGVWSTRMSTLVVEELHGGRLQFAACHTMILNESFLLRELAPALTTAEVKTVIAARYCRDWTICVPPFPRVESCIVSRERKGDKEERGMAHSKAMILCYPAWCRVIITSGNFSRRDFERKTQSIWWQDFPLKQAGNPLEALARGIVAADSRAASSGGSGSAASSRKSSSGRSAVPIATTVECSEFEAILLDYHRVVAGTGAVTPMLTALEWIPRYDFSCALAQLVTSVPSWETGRRLHAYGHMRLRFILQREAEAAAAAAAAAAARSATAPARGGSGGLGASREPIPIDVDDEDDIADGLDGDGSSACGGRAEADERTLVLQVSSFGAAIGSERQAAMAEMHDVESCGYVMQQLLPSMQAIHHGEAGAHPHDRSSLAGASRAGTTSKAAAFAASSGRKRPPDAPATAMVSASAAKRGAGTGSTSAPSGAPLRPPLPRMLLMVPSIGFVRDSSEGWLAGDSLQFSFASVFTLLEDKTKPGTMRVYDGSIVGRGRSSPHIKTMCEAVFHSPATAPPRPPWQAVSAAVSTSASGASAGSSTSIAASAADRNASASSGPSAAPASPDAGADPRPITLSWVYTGSHNISNIAWGLYTTKGGKRHNEVCNSVRNYEMGVVITPLHYASALARLRDQRLRMAQVAGIVASTEGAATAAGAGTTSASSAGAAAPPAALESAVPPRIILVPGNIADWHEGGPVASLVPSAIVPPVPAPAFNGAPGEAAVVPPLPPVLHVMCPIPCALPGEAYPHKPVGAGHPWFQVVKDKGILPGIDHRHHRAAGRDVFRERFKKAAMQPEVRTSASRPLPPGWPLADAGGDSDDTSDGEDESDDGSVRADEIGGGDGYGSDDAADGDIADTKAGGHSGSDSDE